MRRAPLLAVLALLVAAPASAAETRYSLAGGCYVMRDAESGRFVSKDGDRFAVTATTAAAAYPIRMQASALGEYLLYGADKDFATASGTRVIAELKPSGEAQWRVRETAPDRFTLTIPESGQRFAGGAAFEFVAAKRCQQFPEIEVNTSGKPYVAPYEFSETKGLIETHLHGMAFEFLGGSLHCGRPWHPQGPSVALVDCPDHEPDGFGPGAVAENFLAHGNPSSGHDTNGWPTFSGWPHYRTYVHEQTYWRWMERAWRGGLRLYTNLLVENSVLCDIYPIKRNSCNEMKSVVLQAKDLREMEAYIDAQSGGPGKGWLRIVTDPYQARKVINDGKLAVVMGIETSKLFDCGEYDHVPQCTRELIDEQFDEAYRLGVRQMELVNKNDNALVGVAGDGGTFGVITNQGNKYETNHYWAMDTCRGPDPEHNHDQEQTARDELVGGLLHLFLPPETAPVYGPPPHCNQQGLTDLGAYVIRKMIKAKMIFDPDHMSVVGRDHALSIIEANDYGGVMSSHSWSTRDAYRRIMALGGVVTPAPKSTEGFLADWKELKAFRNPRYLYGTGFSTDMNGFAAQGGPREGADKNPLPYPFKSLDGAVTLDRQKSGERVYDLNKDGTAHFGLYPDRIADIAHVGGKEIAGDLLRGAEAYIQMWERADGVLAPTCRAAQRRFTQKGLGEIRLGDGHVALLKRAGQPNKRPGRVWTWCANGTRNGEVKAVLTPGGRVALVVSTAPFHRARNVGRGTKARLLRGKTRSFGKGILARAAAKDGSRMVYGVREGRVTFSAVASKTALKSSRTLKAYLGLAGLR